MSNQNEFNFRKGDDAAQQGMALARGRRDVQLWKRDAEIWFAKVLLGAEFSADDLITGIGLPDEKQNNVVGAWFSAKSKRRQIRWTGHFRMSERVARHTGLQRVWRKI